jgi:hypothetical protein
MKSYLNLVAILLVSGVAAQPNYALNLNGSSQYASIGAPLASGSSYTKEAWIYLTTTSGSRNIISPLNSPFWISGGTLAAGQAGNYTVVTDPTPLAANQWIHTAVTYDAPTNTMRLYRDGTLVSTNSSAPAFTSENHFIGAHGGTASFLQGYVDEVRIWSIALTQAQLKANLYGGPANNASGLVAYYKCDAGSGTTLVNSCTNTTGLDGTLQNAAGWIASPIQASANAVSFDGSNDIITIPDNSTLDITSAITLEAWCYATKNTGVQNVINKSSNSSNTGYIFPRTDNGWTSAIFYLHIGGWQTLSAAYPSLNAWHHLAATYDGAEMRLYINGTLAASRAQTGSITTNGNPLTLGNQLGFAEYFGGIADEFRVWNVARTQSQIQAGMNKELDPTTQTGLVSYYRMNQGIAAGANSGLTTIIDLRGTNNGVMGNFALSGASSNFVSQNSSIIVLPLTWVSFSASLQGQGALLQWRTASEQNTKEFIVQHSVSGNVWNELARLPAAGNSVAIADYEYLHSPLAAGTHYYRVVQMDIDGKSSYSPVRIVTMSASGDLFQVLKNPSSGNSIRLNLHRSAILSVYSSEGKLLWQGTAASGNVMLSVPGSGIYIVKAGNQTEKIIVQ